MKEPHRTQFAALVLRGASVRDIHDSSGHGSYDTDHEAGNASGSGLVERELSRVEGHLRTLCKPLLARIGSVSRILDVGCGTGGTTAALALAWPRAERVVGVDASALAVEAAAVRARGLDLSHERVSFVHVPSGSELPFDSGTFDLVTGVSVLEFVTAKESRRAITAEMLRVLRPGGHVFVATPSPFRLREQHSRRLLGDWRRRPGYPWASRPASVREMFAGARRIALADDRLKRHPLLWPLAWTAPAISWAFPWQKYLFEKLP